MQLGAQLPAVWAFLPAVSRMDGEGLKGNMTGQQGNTYVSN